MKKVSVFIDSEIQEVASAISLENAVSQSTALRMLLKRAIDIVKSEVTA
jgi:antitoxin component of RelBE/YafQ-DinJ toxin-antitoxin module